MRMQGSIKDQLLTLLENMDITHYYDDYGRLTFIFNNVGYTMTDEADMIRAIGILRRA